MTMRYSHLAPDHLTAAVEAVASEQLATKVATGNSSGKRKRTEKSVNRRK
jgi:hypothetical protein